MEQFTKGPWKVCENSAGSIEVYIGDRFTNIRHDEYLCIGVSTDTDTDNRDCTNNPKAEANAHLIAAAPEMYEMLKSFLCLEGIIKTGPIIDLLTKARGESCGK